MKVIVNYDPASGHLRDKYDTIIGTWQNLEPLEDVESASGPSVTDLVSLKQAGYNTDEIMALKASNLI